MTNDLIKARSFGLLSSPAVVIDGRTGATGSYEDWVAAFAERWAEGVGALDRFLDIMAPDIRLTAPGLKPTVGREAGTAAFARVFAALPDLTAKVRHWAARDERLFIEMTFEATIANRRVRWNNIDAFRFENGFAKERVAYFDNAVVRRAFLKNMTGVGQFVRLRFISPKSER